MSRAPQFNRPVEYDPTLIRQQASQNVSRPQQQYKTREQLMKNDLGFDDADVEEETKTAEAQQSHQSTASFIRSVYGEDVDVDLDGEQVGDEEIEKLVEQVAAAREGQMKAEAAARRSEERVEELQKMSKQAKNILVKQFKDQINALLRELDEQKQMLADDDETINTLRQALNRWEHGDEAGAREFQQQIKQGKDNRELERQINQLTKTLEHKEQQIKDIQEELDNQKVNNNALIKRHNDEIKQITTSNNNIGKIDSKGDAEDSNASNHINTELRNTINDLETANNHLNHKIIEQNTTITQLQQQVYHLHQQQEKDLSVADSRSTQHESTIEQLDTQIKQLQQSLGQHQLTISSQQREMDHIKKVNAESIINTASASLSAAAEREQRLNTNIAQVGQEKLVLQQSLSESETNLQRREEEYKSFKDKAREKLSTASEAIKKLKAEYANLRTSYTKLKTDGTTQQQKLIEDNTAIYQKQARQLREANDELQLTKSDLSDLRMMIQAQSAAFLNHFQPVLLRAVQHIADQHKAATATLTVAYRKEQSLRKQLFNQLQELKGNIRVYCRIRPLSNTNEPNAITFGPEENSLTIMNIEKKIGHQFQFEQVFQPTSTQPQVFNEVSELVTSVMDGYNVCIFAYGQTGSGKTFTMQGNKDNPGVNIRALEQLFQTAYDRSVDTDYNISISLLEIYNEKIQDLLSSEPAGTALKAVQGPHGMTVQDLTIIPVSTSDHVIDALAAGSKNRKVSSTAMNADSSRSHLILSVYVLGKSKFALPSGQTREVMGKLHLIDLAGSERISRSGVTGDGLKEAQAINSSLSALGNCIAARANKNAHVPYRDSALTYLLQDSLEKNSKTLMVVQVSPNGQDSSESICSLRFAERVRKVELGKAAANVKKSNSTGNLSTPS